MQNTELTDDQTVDVAAMLMVDSRLMDLLLAREETVELRRELDNLKALISDWAHAQYVPADHKPGDDLLPWLRRADELSKRLMRAGGVEPRIVPEGEP